MKIRMNNANVQSQVISLLRLPLVFFVLLIHSNFYGVSEAWNAFWGDATISSNATLPTVGAFIDFLSYTIALLANPFFFFISGLLFFREGTFSRHFYLRKLQSRVFTLLIPYLLWNLIYLFGLSLVEAMKPGWTAIIDKPIQDFNLTDWLLAFWDISLIGHQGGKATPVAIQFWFIRDLMVITLCSPVIYLLLSRLSKFRKEIPILFFMALLYASKWVDNVPGISFQGFLFFSFGAYFGVSKQCVATTMRPLPWVGMFFAIFAHQVGSLNLMYAGLIIFIIGMTTRFVDYRLQQNKTTDVIPHFLSDASFFIFAYHTLFLGALLWLFKTNLLVPHTATEAIAIYLFSPILMLFLGAGIHALLHRLCPRFLSILTGGR